MSQQSKDWSASQYLKFENERTQPARDLLSHVPLTAPKRIIDLGCGPANSTTILANQYPSATITGLDSSPDMIERAKKVLPDREFHVTDLNTYMPDPAKPVDLFFSNAVFQWLKADDRIAVIKRLLQPQQKGAVFALQVPHNLNEPSHLLMDETAADGPWAGKIAGAQRDGFQSPQELYDLVKPFCSQVSVFETSYYHSLESHEAVIEWVKGTGLRPFLDPLEDGEKEAFLKGYLRRLQAAYPVSVDGRVLLKYPRLFMVAVK
ncbi:Trans-aconitate 2-methyltransferase C-terminal [Penicillium concentricum]|uniref:Trans-aconitate 2-methyltransferase C-terminal n=1 Tax=Penicillium concentricum TaxID=293559 RepID=A0A9X0B280_9EURO|nr:Trans-aconitate 2-methyltransferase C-terminal [Penicillium concentricum]KAJ5385521.1 Trans-aconitate 2-methyltransferase C-terminal [Penicillium concentricum]